MPLEKVSAAASEVQVLYSSDMLRTKIKYVLEDPKPNDRRVVLVAFVGGQAETFLPDPDGLQLICALQPGATDGITLSRLKNRGARLFKSDSLHMKVYWSERKGCVICSANASGNALGGGKQKEAGAWFPPGTVDIDRLLLYADPKPVQDRDLKHLTNDHGGEPSRPNPDTQARVPDFSEWLTLAGRKDWKLGWWDDEAPFAKVARDKALTSYGVTEPNDFLNVAKEQAGGGNWFLAFRLPQVTELCWMYIDFVVRVPENSKAYDRDYPYQAVQLHAIHNYPAPPFRTDASFQRAFTKAIKKYGTERVERADSLVPCRELIRLIATNAKA